MTLIQVHFVGPDDSGVETHEIEEFPWNAEIKGVFIGTDWDSRIFDKILNADYCWLADKNGMPFFVVKHRTMPTKF